ncbi:MAG: homocysteine S-methyltransferase family protein, partial [Planctomycetes bacterium]|nr:homocysteine S-methyltransferase family protein [Planctomycetota bacterium]
MSMDLIDHPFVRALEERILVLDGAMGTFIQAEGLTGNNDEFCRTHPEVIAGIHRRYLEAGADIIETNTFNATAISQADYGLEDECYAINLAAAQVARTAADTYMEEHGGAQRFVAGSMGPTNRTASMSPDVGDPGARTVTFEELVSAYGEQARGLLDGGCDVLLVEPVFDTLNCKAALFAIDELLEERGQTVPVLVSGTITD